MPITEELVQAAPVTSLSRAQILEATTRCLREEGYDNTTIRRIASHLDCAVGSIYRYFRDKRDLLAAVAQGMLAPVADAAERGVPVLQTTRQYHEAASADGPTYRMMFWLASLSPAEPVPAVVLRIVQAWALQLGSLRAAQEHWSSLHGSIMLSTAFDSSLAHPLPAAEHPRRHITPSELAQMRTSASPVTVPVVLPVDSNTRVEADDMALL